MNKIRELTHVLITLLIVAGISAVMVIVADGLGVWDTFRAQQQVRASEARARELEAQAAALRERQALMMTWVMSFASTKDSLLVIGTYITGGLSLISALIVIGVLLIERGDRHERDV